MSADTHQTRSDWSGEVGSWSTVTPQSVQSHSRVSQVRPCVRCPAVCVSSELSSDVMLLLAILCLLPLPLARSLPVLLPGAADQVSAGYRSSVRLGREVRDYTRLEIMVRTAGLVEDSGDLARTGVSVELKSGGEKWRVVESEASVRGGVYTWQVAVAPCLSYRVRLWLEDTRRSGMMKSAGLAQSVWTTCA